MILKFKTNAKLNLTLDIAGVRGDGYHEIESIFHSINLADEITLRAVEGGRNVEVDSVLGPCGEQNLAYKAAKMFLDFTNLNYDIKISIDKQIPLLSGLGGASANAAGVLLALNKAANNILPYNELHTLALNLGADVPFCLTGGTAFVSGIGEKIQPLNHSDFHFVLIKSYEKKSTAEQYKMLDLLNVQKTDFTRNFMQNPCILNEKSVNNVFKAVNFECEKILQSLCSAGAIVASLSGSGPTCFGIFVDEKSAKNAKNILKSTENEVFYAKSTENSTDFFQ